MSTQFDTFIASYLRVELYEILYHTLVMHDFYLLSVSSCSSCIVGEHGET